MPRLPTMRVMGSHAISTTSLSASCGVLARVSSIVVIAARLSVREVVAVGGKSPVRAVAGLQGCASRAPLGFLVDGAERDAAQLADHRSVDRAGGHGRDFGARRLVHE